MILKINCDECDARKINEDNYKDYEEITINTDELIVDDRSKAILNKLPFNIHADEVVSGEDYSRENQLTVNGIYEINENTKVEEGTNLCVNGYIKIYPGTEETIAKYGRISVNGYILMPKSIEALFPMKNLSLNGITKVYPDGYVLLSNEYKIDKYFPLRAEQGMGYYSAKCMYDFDAETDFAKLLEKNVRFNTEKVYIRKNHLESALPLFNIEAEIVEIPEECAVLMADGETLNDHIVSTYGKKLFIIGDIVIGNETGNALASIEQLIVDGEVKIDKKNLERFNEIGASCNKLVVTEGLVLCDRAIMTIDKKMLDDHEEGVKVCDCALVKIDKDIPADIISKRLKISDCAKVNCSPEQKTAVELVSTDVALISSAAGSSMGSAFGDLVGKITDRIFDNDFSGGASGNGDVKYINADYYEL
jgi:hypothetical protein